MKDLHATYYGSDLIQTRILNRHIEGSRHTHLMKSVYNEKNILYAIKRVASNKGRNTPGPDGLSVEPISKIPYESIPYNKLQVHHIKPLSKGGLDTFSNMVLITEENHRLIHSNKQIMGDKNFVKAINKYREMLN